MENLFTYGTLQNDEVQLATFGRKLEGHADALPAYTVNKIQAKSGTGIHRNLQFTGDPSDFVAGTVYSLTLKELEAADAYEPDGYKRVLIQLRSGANAWVYIHYGNTN